MPTYITVNFTPTDTDKLQQYGNHVPATLSKYGGEYLLKGPVESLFGASSFAMQVILVFPSRELANAWYHSAEYQALIPLREAGMRSQFQLVGD